MRKRFKTLLSDVIIRYIVFATSTVTIIQLAIALLFFQKLPPLVPLFNQQPWGQQQLGRNIDIFLPILFTFVIFVVNTLLASSLYEKMPLISRLLCITSLFITFFTFLLITRTILLVV